MFLWRFVRERGHSVFGVEDARVQALMTNIIKRHTTLQPLNVINSGGTHQQVFRGGTVIAYFDDLPGLAELPKNVRSYIVWNKERRRRAADELVLGLKALGYEASVHEPLKDFPPGTFLLVKSNAFLDSGHAFRPHWIKMAFLEATMKKK